MYLSYRRMKKFSLRAYIIMAIGLVAVFLNGCYVIDYTLYGIAIVKARKYFLIKNFEKASVYYEKVASKDPNGTWGERALFMWGVCEFNLGNYEKAKEIFKTIVKNKKFLNYKKAAQFYLGLTYMKLNDYIQAKSVLEKVIKGSPRTIYALKSKKLVKQVTEKLESMEQAEKIKAAYEKYIMAYKTYTNLLLNPILANQMVDPNVMRLRFNDYKKYYEEYQRLIAKARHSERLKKAEQAYKKAREEYRKMITGKDPEEITRPEVMEVYKKYIKLYEKYVKLLKENQKYIKSRKKKEKRNE